MISSFASATHECKHTLHFQWYRGIRPHVLGRWLAVYMSGWMNMLVACLSCRQLALSFDSFVRHTWRDPKPLKAREATLKPGLKDEIPSSFSLSRTENPHIFSHWTIPSLSHDAIVVPLPHPTPHTHIYSLSYFPLFFLSFSSFVLWFFSPPHLCPSITVRSFTGSQGALYPPDTMPPIHITSRDTDANFLKGT